jgi:hypothetical protein
MRATTVLGFLLALSMPAAAQVGPLRVETKDGSRIAFVRETRGSLLAGIVVTRSDGTLVREILFRPAEAHVSGMRWVESPEWISNRRLVASGSGVLKQFRDFAAQRP